MVNALNNMAIKFKILALSLRYNKGPRVINHITAKDVSDVEQQQQKSSLLSSPPSKNKAASKKYAWKKRCSTLSTRASTVGASVDQSQRTSISAKVERMSSSKKYMLRKKKCTQAPHGTNRSCPTSSSEELSKVERPSSSKKFVPRMIPPLSKKKEDTFSIVRYSDATYLFLDTECIIVGDLEEDDLSFSSEDSDDMFSERAFQIG